MRILALDYGDRRIGVAIGETKVGVAHARPFLPNDQNLWRTLAEVCATEKIELILVGLPTSLSGESSRQTEIVKTFVAELNRKIQLPIVELDERFTTLLASMNLKLRELKAHEQKKFVDSESARLLLAEWFERHADEF